MVLSAYFDSCHNPSPSPSPSQKSVTLFCWLENQEFTKQINVSGPSLWSKWYPVADLGERQSPIDIVTKNAVPGQDDLPELKYQYDPANIRIINTGSSWRMDFSSDGTNLSGGPLQGNYKVSVF